MSNDQSLNTVEECARSFMSKYEQTESLQHVFVPGFLGTPHEKIPAFRLPLKSEDCCDLCEQLGRLAVKAIGPDLRLELIEVRFFPSRYHLVLKIHLPEDNHESPTYFIDRCFYIYSHPDVLCPWYLFNTYPFQKLEWAFDKLQECATDHNCYAKDPTPLPTRVIRVGRKPDDIRLQNGGSCARYICLSHCWGSKQPLITNKRNVDDHFGCIVWEDMPLLYQDTIRLAWRLGIDYVWIDSLCIIQNSADDWAREAGRMQNVYGNSWLTVAATSNPDCCSGILDHPRDEETRTRFASFKGSIQYSGLTHQNRPFCWLAVPGDINTCKDDKHGNGNCRWPLLTRGWVLQERLLSPRVLYFTAASLLWSCKEDKKEEEADVGHCHQPTHMGVRDRDPCSNARSWLDIIEEYSKLKFTNQNDRLPALSGLAQRSFKEMPPGTKYLAGLWSDSLIQGLSWHNALGSHDENDNATGGILTGCTRHLNQIHRGTPSWSWAAINTAVIFPRSVVYKSGKTIFHVQISETECTPMSHHDPTGRVKNGIIHIRGPISPIMKSDHTLIDNRNSKIYFDCPVHMDFDYLIDKKIKCLILYTEKGYANLHSRERIYYSVGLLLQPVEGKDFQYRRAGLVTEFYYPDVTYHPSAWFKRLSRAEEAVII